MNDVFIHSFFREHRLKVDFELGKFSVTSSCFKEVFEHKNNQGLL